MRRVFMRFLPVFLLSLALQVLAPVAACLARSIAATDPLAGAILCQGAVAGDVGNKQQNHHMRDGSCAACAAVVAFAPPAPQIVPAAFSQHVYRVAWHAYAPSARSVKLSFSAQARGPPNLS